jgi:hypothetical protein
MSSRRQKFVDRRFASRLSELVRGAPFGKDRALESSSFVLVSLRKMSRARVVWVNWTYLVELGFPAPSNGVLTPSLEQVLLDAFAYRAPEPDDAPDALEGPPVKFYADRYGGSGAGYNLGSGRAASRGAFQIKGTGATPLVHAKSSYSHRDGALRLENALREAVWGEIDQEEFPFGANRAVAVIDAGCWTRRQGEPPRRRGLLVRPFPVRPAHVVPNLRHNPDADALRRQQRRIVGLLPTGEDEVQENGSRVRRGLLELVTRVAAQDAAGIVRKIRHGSINTTNIEITGKLLDYGTQSAQPGHGTTTPLPAAAPLSTSRAAVRIPSVIDSLQELAFAFAIGLPGSDGSRIPAADEIERTFKLHHGRAVLEELIGLCGLPTFVLQGRSPSKSYWALAFGLYAAAFNSARTMVPIYARVPRWTAEYDVGRILVCLATIWRQDVAGIRHALLDSARDKLVEDVIDTYVAFRREMERESAGHGCDPAVLDDLIVRLAAIRNEDRRALFRDIMIKSYERRVAVYGSGGDSEALGRRVDEDIVDGRRFFRASRAGEVVLRAWEDRQSAGRGHIRYCFVPGRGYVLDICAYVEDGAVAFFGGPRCAAEGLTAVVDVVDGRGRASRHEVPLRVEPQAARVEVDVDQFAVRAQVRIERRRREHRGAHGVRVELVPRCYSNGIRRIMKSRSLRESIVPLDYVMTPRANSGGERSA